MIDLNRFVPAGSHLTVTDGETINDPGQIAASGMLASSGLHAAVLIPCHRRQGCRDGGRHEGPQSSTATSGPAAAADAPLKWTPNEMAAKLKIFKPPLLASAR